MYALLKQCKVKTNIALSLGLLYATTFSIQYWTMRQGFSSWGAALLPFCFIPAIHYVFYQKVEPIRLSLSMALIFQIHVLSALMLVMMYLPFYLYTFVKSPIAKKKETFVQVVIAVILFLLLTVNVWLVLLYLRGTNHLLDPFINREIGFLDIPRLIETAMNAYTSISDYTLDDVLEADKWAREYTSKIC